MKKRLLFLICLLVPVLVCCGCMCGRSHDGEATFVPPPAETISYAALTEGSRATPPRWRYVNMYDIFFGGDAEEQKGVGPTDFPQDTYLSIAAELEEIFGSHPLYALQAPQDGPDYDEYVRDLLHHGPEFLEWPLLYVAIATEPMYDIPDNEAFLCYVQIVMESPQKCYIQALYQTKRDINSTAHVYVCDDEAVLNELWDWAEGYFEKASEAPAG